MAHDVFISHSNLDKLAADAVCHGLEAQGVRCWMAPRDQFAGKPYGEQITEAIQTAKVMVLVFSENVNNSQAVLNEINLAANANVTIVPFRIAGVAFNPELNYYLGRTHWLDAFPQPVEAYIDTLVATVRRNLGGPTPTPPPGAPPMDEAGAARRGPPPIPPITPIPSIPPGRRDRSRFRPPRRSTSPLALIVRGVLGSLFLILLIVMFWPRARSPGAERAANTVIQAVANSIAKEADDDDDDDRQAKPAAAPPVNAAASNAAAGAAP